MNDLNIACFLSAVRTGNLSVTARELYITQQAVSRNIQKLEEELGFELFLRRNNAFSLTHAGEEYFRWLTDFNEKLFNAEQLFREKRRSSESILCIGWCSRSGLPPELERAAALFRRENPALRMEFREGGDDEVSSFLKNGLIDAAIVPENCPVLTLDNIESTLLMTLPVYAVTAGDELSSCNICLTDSPYLDGAELAGLGLSAGSIERFPNPVSVFATLRRGGCFTVSTENAVTRCCGELRFFPLKKRAAILFARPRGSVNSAAGGLCAFLRAHLAGNVERSEPE